MARISLLFSLALVLAIGSVLAHPPTHKKPQKHLCPPTLAGLQSFSYVEISKLIEKRTAISAPNSSQFKALLAICKGYNDYLGSLKFSDQKDVFGSLHIKYSLMTRAMLAAQASLGVEGHLAAKLGKSYSAMAGGFGELVEKIGEISKTYKFNANAKISKSDQAKIDKCLIKLKGSITVFLKVIAECSKNASANKKIDFPFPPGGDIFGASVSKGLGIVGKVGGGHAGGFFGFGGNVQFDAAANAKVGGGH